MDFSPFATKPALKNPALPCKFKGDIRANTRPVTESVDSPMDLYALAARHVKAIVDLLTQHDSTDKIVLVAYSREEYNEFRKFPEICRMMATCSNSTTESSFRRSKAPSYYWLVEKKQPDSQATRACFANEKYGRENGEK